MRISVAGGFINPQTQLFALPGISIYGDGDVIAPDFSGVATGIVPALTLTKLSEAGLQQILGLAGADGLLGKNGHYDSGPVPEASTTTFVVIADGHQHTVSVTALGHQGGDASTQALRDKLAAFEQALQDVTTAAGAGNVVAGPSAYAPAQLEVFVTPFDGQPASGTPQVAWPLATPLASFGTPVRGDSGGGGINTGSLSCGVVGGADLARLQPAMASATVDSVWSSDAAYFSLTIRPMLPDETGCPGT